MKIVVCMDSFKGTLSAAEACDIVARGLHTALPEAEILTVPLGDGGEGTADAIARVLPSRWRYAPVMGPLPEMKVEAAWLEIDRGDIKEAIVEMAQASGMVRLRPEQLDPARTTTWGTGELIQKAADEGVNRIYLGVGGSATVDGGTGAAGALGWRFRDSAGNAVFPCGGNLRHIAQIEPPTHLKLPPVEVLCDVRNPLCGPDGAARVFAPQKGADESLVAELEAGLEHLAALVEKQLGKKVRELPGAGAAGGLAAGAVAFMGARLLSGIATVIQITGVASKAADADWIVTGEGSFDEQSLMGKVVSGVAQMAAELHVPVAVLAGRSTLRADACPDPIKIVMSASEPGEPQDRAIAEARDRLARTARQLGIVIKQGYPG